MVDESNTIIRLNALMKAGYKIDENSSQEVRDAIWLWHPAESRAQEPHLILYSDGLLVALERGRKVDVLRIGSDKNVEFNDFVRTVPRATIIEKSRPIWSGVFAWVFIGVVSCVILLLVNIFSRLFK